MSISEKHLAFDECAQRWPRLTKHLMWVGCLSPTEAGACIRDYRTARQIMRRDRDEGEYAMRWYGSEAVCHAGGPLKLIQWAVRERHRIREALKRWK